MPQPNNKSIILRLTQSWKMQAVAANLLLTAALSLLAFTVFRAIWMVQVWWLIPLFLVAGIIVFLLFRQWQLSADDVATYLNKNVAPLEESAGLLLRTQQSLNFLESLQQQRINQQLAKLKIANPLSRYLIVAVVSLAMAALLLFLLPRFKFNFEDKRANESVTSSLAEKKETRLPAISSSFLTITPPAYTSKKARRQSRFNVQVEEYSKVMWNLETNVAAQRVQLVFNNSVVVSLNSVGSTKQKWVAERTISKNGFYQVKIDGTASELYQVEVIKDKPPTIQVQSPKPGTLIENGQPQQVPLSVTLSDDYGVADATIFATVATGSGEAVKFNEQQIGLNKFRPARLQDIRQIINLRSLGMAPGDELYFYIKALDNHGQQTRSDVFMVTLQDTADLMSIDGLVMGVDLKPEFFRSQRQIIIETEQLLKSKDTMSVKDFNNKSNDLGVDQKLLRLRYGKFLGEESNTEAGGEHEDHEGHDEEKEGAASFGNENAIMDQFSHKHDIAEDATFFDPETKKQLKATLAEMWNAEGKLRTLKPAEALPFEYKALRLLKDLQQKSRVYVAKTSSKTTPLKPIEKRLTGELDKVQQPEFKRKQERTKLPADEMRMALALLEKFKNQAATPAQLNNLKVLAEPLSENAAANPRQYLTALQAYRKIMSGNGNLTNISTLQRAIQSILRTPQALPYQPGGAVPRSLGDMYFKNLKTGSR